MKTSKKVRDSAKKSYLKIRSDPKRLDKFRAYKRAYYRKNSAKIIEYQINKVRFGGNKHDVFKRDNNQCQICFVGKKGKNILIHHIDGNGRGSKTPNNDINNLILLCQSCHSVVHKFNKLKDNSIFKKLVKELS